MDQRRYSKICGEFVAGGDKAYLVWIDRGINSSENGEFFLPGLFPRPYELTFWNIEKGILLRAGPFVPGPEQRIITLPKDFSFARVAGRVITKDGQALAGVGVSWHYEVFSNLDSLFVSQSYLGSQTRTDREGRFELLNIPRENVECFVDGKTINSQQVNLQSAGDIENWEIVATRQCRIKIQTLQNAYAGVRFFVLDEKQDFLPMKPDESYTGIHGGLGQLDQNGNSAEYWIPESARALLIQTKPKGKYIPLPPLKIDELNVISF